MFKVEIFSAETTTESGRNNNTGKNWSYTKQDAFIHLDSNSPYPKEFKITLDENQQPYPIGIYKFSPESIKIDNFKNLSIDNLILIPMPNEVKKSA